MTRADERARNPISVGELERRWAAVRALMPAAGIEALIVQGANNLAGTGGHFRWLTGITSAQNSKPQTVIFPRDGLMTLVGHGRFNEDMKLDGTDPTLPGSGAASAPRVLRRSTTRTTTRRRSLHERSRRAVSGASASSAPTRCISGSAPG